MVERGICFGRKGGEKTIGARPTRVFSLRTHQNSISSNWEENRGKVIVADLQSNKWNILSFYVLDLVLTIIFSGAYDLLENCFWTWFFFVTFFFFSRHNFSFLIILGNQFFFFRPPFFSNGHHLLIRVYEYIYINIFFSSLHFSTLNQTQWWKLKSLIFSYFSVFFPFSILLMFPFPHLNRPYEMSYAYTYISKLCSDTNFE